MSESHSLSQGLLGLMAQDRLSAMIADEVITPELLAEFTTAFTSAEDSLQKSCLGGLLDQAESLSPDAGAHYRQVAQKAMKHSDDLAPLVAELATKLADRQGPTRESVSKEIKTARLLGDVPCKDIAQLMQRTVELIKAEDPKVTSAQWVEHEGPQAEGYGDAYGYIFVGRTCKELTVLTNGNGLTPEPIYKYNVAIERLGEDGQIIAASGRWCNNYPGREFNTRMIPQNLTGKKGGGRVMCIPVDKPSTLRALTLPEPTI